MTVLWQRLAVVGAAILVLAGPAGAEKVYWADSGNRRIQRANLDGTEVEDLITDTDSPGGLALDLPAGKMYWTSQVNDSIECADLDGANAEQVIGKGLGDPLAIAVDSAGGKIYWSENQTDRLRRANLDGTDVEDLVIVRKSSSIGGLDLDLAGGKMYWADGLTRYVSRANLDGTDIEPLAGDVIFPGGLGLDLEHGKIDFSGVLNEAPFPNKLYRANLDGSELESLLVISEGFNSTIGVAVDPEGGKVYFTDFVSDTVQRADLDGGNVEVIVDSVVTPRGLALDLRPELPCPGDLDGDDDVDASDLAALLAAWGDCPGCPEDLDGDGDVDSGDLAELLAVWGACP